MLDPARNKELCIHPNYERQDNPEQFDDRTLRDEWQNAVYLHGLRFAAANNVRRVLDFGCGSGFKLMKYFSGYDTVGYEIEPCFSHLGKVYPDRTWSSEYPPRFIGDMLICADVIEHMEDPSALMRKLADSSVGAIFLSTPALEVLAERGQSRRYGPPDNKSHINEWTTLEFRSYVAMFLDIVEHVIPDCGQGTQLIVARPK